MTPIQLILAQVILPQLKSNLDVATDYSLPQLISTLMLQLMQSSLWTAPIIVITFSVAVSFLAMKVETMLLAPHAFIFPFDWLLCTV